MVRRQIERCLETEQWWKQKLTAKGKNYSSSLVNPGQFSARTSNDLGSVFDGNSFFNLPTGDMHLTLLFCARIRLKQLRHVFFSKDLLQ